MTSMLSFSGRSITSQVDKREKEASCQTREVGMMQRQRMPWRNHPPQRGGGFYTCRMTVLSCYHWTPLQFSAPTRASSYNGPGHGFNFWFYPKTPWGQNICLSITRQATVKKNQHRKNWWVFLITVQYWGCRIHFYNFLELICAYV